MTTGTERMDTIDVDVNLASRNDSMEPNSVTPPFGTPANTTPTPSGNLENGKIIQVSQQVVRFIMSNLQGQNSIISKVRLQNVIKDCNKRENNRPTSFKVLFEQINLILDDVYGYQLSGIPPRNLNKNKEFKLDHRADQFILLNKLDVCARLNQFQLDFGDQLYESMVIEEEYMGQDNMLNMDNVINNNLGNERELCMRGVLTVVLCVILFSKNSILQEELYKFLEQFGIPTDGNKIPILETTLPELLKTLERKEYIQRQVENTRLEVETVLYSVGRRTQWEFNVHSLTQLVMQVMAVEDSASSAQWQQDIQQTVGDAYSI